MHEATLSAACQAGKAPRQSGVNAEQVGGKQAVAKTGPARWQCHGLTLVKCFPMGAGMITQSDSA